MSKYFLDSKSFNEILFGAIFIEQSLHIFGQV